MANRRNHQPTDVGRAAEDRALAAMQAAGLNFLERNFSCRYGEIDLVMQHGETVVFVEVRLRKSDRFGGAAASITPAKQRRLLAAAAIYMKARRCGSGNAMRFDVVTFDGSPDTSQARMQWIRGALDQH